MHPLVLTAELPWQPINNRVFHTEGSPSREYTQTNWRYEETWPQYSPTALWWYEEGGGIINSLWPNDAIWRQRSGSTLAQVMAWCLTAPSHYLNQCWFTFSKVHWHSFEYILQEMIELSITKISWKITFLKFLWNLTGANQLKIIIFKLTVLIDGWGIS